MKEDRKTIFDKYDKLKDKIERPFLLYDRYHEADQLVAEFVKRKVPFSDLRVLDFGCGVGDYGITFVRKGSSVLFEDISEQYIDFVKYRLSLEKLPWHDSLDYNFAIFGEVLEHLDDPLGKLEEAHSRKTKYIFTSSYPYRSDDPNDRYWTRGGHTSDARLAQPKCRKLLELNYNCVTFNGAVKLWTSKKQEN
jgi:SAM-dependent methyltransferase